MALGGYYQCPNCRAPRDRIDTITKATKDRPFDELHIKYECGTYMQVHREGRNWSLIATITKCLRDTTGGRVDARSGWD